MDGKKVLEVTDKLCDDLNKRDLNILADTLDIFRKFRTGKATIKEVDDWLLFTPRKPKYVAYQIEEVMHPQLKSIRSEIEMPSTAYSKEEEEEDIKSIFDGVVQQAKERNK